MSGFLEQMAEASAERVARARAEVSESELLARAHASPRPPRLALDARGFDLMAEVKLSSPAVGLLAPAGRDTAERELSERVVGYARAGAAAVSVLTEPTRFDGSLEHLAAASRALAGSRVPAMRKDFLVDPYQVLEARATGAGGVLVILRMLSDRQARVLTDCAREMALFVLLEAFDEADLERACRILEATRARAGPGASGDAQEVAMLVGLNCRDLDTLAVVPGRLEALADRLPVDAPRVAESGIATPADAARAAAAGYDLALVGSALMTCEAPADLVRDMLVAGRAAARAHKA